MTRLTPGMHAPDFTLQNHDSTSVSLRDYRGQRVIVYFYPEALTPACRAQTCDFNDREPSLADAGFAVLGISRDPVAKLAAAAAADSIRFPLLSDEDLAVHVAWDVFGEKSLYGKIVQGVRRSTFVLDGNGVVEHAFYNTKAKGHLEMLRKRLGFA